MCGFAMVIWRGSAHKPPQRGVVVGWSGCIRVGGFVLQGRECPVLLYKHISIAT